MAAAGPSDDFFGAGYVGFDPSMGGRSDYLNQLATIHGIITSNGQAAPGDGVPTPPSSRSWGSWSSPGGFSSSPGQMGIGDPAANAQVNNPTNVTRGGSLTNMRNNLAGQLGATTGASQNFNYKGTNIPQDLQGLRTGITGYLQSQLGQGPAQYDQSNFNLGMPLGAQESYGWANSQPGQIGYAAQGGMDTANNLMGFNAGADFSSLNPALAQLLGGANNGQLSQFANQGFNSAMQYGGQQAQALGQMQPTAMNIAQTGGVNFQQLLSSLGQIQSSGQSNLNDSLAQIREQYGAQGLGQGSDVSDALGRGAATGWGDVLSRQSSLLSQILGQGTQAQLGGLNALQGISSGYGNVGNLISGASGTAGNLYNAGNQTNIQSLLGGLGQGLNILQQPVQNQLSSAGIQLGAVNAVPGYLGQYNSAYNSAAQNNLGLAQLNQQANQYTNSAQYQNFVRQSGLSPALQAALGYSTSFPPVVPQGPSPWASILGGGIGALGSILGAVL